MTSELRGQKQQSESQRYVNKAKKVSKRYCRHSLHLDWLGLNVLIFPEKSRLSVHKRLISALIVKFLSIHIYYVLVRRYVNRKRPVLVQRTTTFRAE